MSVDIYFGSAWNQLGFFIGSCCTSVYLGVIKSKANINQLLGVFLLFSSTFLQQKLFNTVRMLATALFRQRKN